MVRNRMVECYWVNPAYQDLTQQYFPDLKAACEPQGTYLSRSRHSRLYALSTEKGEQYYVKIYSTAGKYFRSLIGRSRVRAEWENLLYFQTININTPDIIAYGEQRHLGVFQKGVIVTKAVPGVLDLSMLAEKKPDVYWGGVWLQQISAKVAEYTRILHSQGFIHNDLKWRNILVSPAPLANVYFIDCPVGRKRYGWQRLRGMIKDLACLDKKSKYILSHSQRLRFYKQYCQCKKLTKYHKRQIKKVLKFFSGRE